MQQNFSILPIRYASGEPLTLAANLALATLIIDIANFFNWVVA